MAIVTEWTRYDNLHGKQVRVLVAHDDAIADAPVEILDIQFKLTKPERHTALRELFDKRITPPNAPYTYIFQSYLAKARGTLKNDQRNLELQEEPNNAKLAKLAGAETFIDDLHALSALFIPFESSINQVHGPQDLGDLQNKLVAFQTAMCGNPRRHVQGKIEEIKERYTDPRIRQLLEKLKQQLLNQCFAFDEQLQQLSANTPTYEQLRCLTCVQNRDLGITSLGTFMAEQMSTILATGIRAAYTLEDNRLGNLVTLPSHIAALSDAKRAIFSKAFALDGAEYNDTYSPISTSMLDALTTPDVINDDGTAKWFSIKPYVHDWTPLEIDKITCTLTGEALHKRQQPNFLFDIGKFIASLVETGFVIAIRLPVTLLLTAWDFTFSMIGAATGLPLFQKEPDDKWTNYFDQKLSLWHDRLSPAKAAKQAWNRRYRRTELDDGDEHQQLLDQSMRDHSVFHQLFLQFSPQYLANELRSFFQSLWLSMTRIPSEISYITSNLGFTPTPSAEDVYNTAKAHHELVKQYLRYREENPIQAPIRQDTDEAGDDTQEYETPKLCDYNEITSPLEVFREIMLTLSDTVVDPMFRKSPGAATLFFTISLATFGSYLVPQATLGNLGAFARYLQSVTNLLSTHFTGKEAIGFEEQMIACFLEWKLGFFTTELLIEVQQGHYDFLAELFEEPEKISLGIVGLTGMGVLVQYLPLLPSRITLPGGISIPNIYTETINLFIDEARGAATGTFPCTTLEFAFLGLKFGMLLHSMLTGSHLSEAEVRSKQNAITHIMIASKNQGVFRHLESAQRVQAFALIVEEYRSTLTEDEITSLTHYIRDNLPNTADVQEQVLPEAEDHRTELAKAHEALNEAISLLSDSRNPIHIHTHNDAQKLFDHVDSLFNRYNYALQQTGNSDFCIDKRDVLDRLYNHYVYQGSNNLARIFSIIPGYPLTLVWRGIKYATASFFNKPSIMHQIQKSFNKDLVLAFQLLSTIVSTMGAFARGVSYMLRGIIGGIALIVMPIPFLLYRAGASIANGVRRLLDIEPSPPATWNDWFGAIDNAVCNVAFHRIRTPQWLRTIYADASRIAGRNSDLDIACDNAKVQLDAATDYLDRDPLHERANLEVNPNSTTGRFLERFDRARKAAPAAQSDLIRERFRHESNWTPSTWNLHSSLFNEPDADTNQPNSESTSPRHSSSNSDD